ncbi:hypothetical protein [Burkholderia phage BCSR5]|nr:hypothetical protein [Burkholderia phage BCSR5]
MLSPLMEELAVQQPPQSVFATADEAVMVTASPLVSLIEACYLLVIDYLEMPNKPALPDTAAEIKKVLPKAVKVFGKDTPALKDSAVAAISGRSKAEQLALLGTEIKDALPVYSQEKFGFSHEELEVLKSLAHYLRTDSEVALNKIKKYAAITRNTFITSKLTPKEGSQSGVRSQLEGLVSQLVGRKDAALTPEESAVIKETHPEAHKQYLALRRNFNQVWKDFVVAYIRKSGRHLIGYEELLAAMDQMGLDHLLSRGFTGQIDDLGRLYTVNDELIDGAPNAVTFPSVVMNKAYGKPGGGDWIMKAIRADGTDGPYYYTSTFKKGQAKAKFERVALFSNKIDGMRKKWFAEVKKFDPENIKSVCAVILEILYTFSARVGSAKNATEGSPTFGISTLLVKHVKVDPNGNYLLTYKGKGGVATKHRIMKTDPELKFVAKALDFLIADKAPNEPVFTIPSNRGYSLVGAAKVNAYFKALGAGDVTVHKLRTLRGTRLFQELSQKYHDTGKRPRNDKEALAILNKMAMEVGKALNHVRNTAAGTKVTGATALANYIDPTCVVELFRSWDLRPPKFLARFDV